MGTSSSLSAAATVTAGIGIVMIIYLVIIAAFIWINYLVAKKFEKIAIDKGHPNSRAFAMCFWLGIVGYLYVIALPNKTWENKLDKFLGASTPDEENSNTEKSEDYSF